MQTYWINVHCRGAGGDAAQAYHKAAKRLMEAAQHLQAGEIFVDEGTRVAMDDPGGGGGPCAPEYIKIEVNVSPSGLPEAESRDDDD
jgi:hypothetical protein